jgi:lipopolysaccharide export system protein LptA
MEKKTLLQITLSFILIMLLFSIFFYSKRSDTNSISSAKVKTEEISTNKNQNIIKDIQYSANSISGDKYELKADYGEINIHNPNLIFMTKVMAIINFKDNDNILITSDFADYNNKTYETTFINNVKIVKKDEIITGDKLYLVLDASKEELKTSPNKEQNLIRLTGNVIFKKPGYNLKTDIIEIDLITKNSKIYMKDKSNKVIVNKFN